MRHSLLISEFLTTPWALMPERLNAFAGVLARWAESGGRTLSAEDTAVAAEARAARRQAASRAGGGSIAVIPLIGVVTQRGNGADDVSGTGGTSTQQFAQLFRECMADDTIGSILIDIDSPGGSVYGIAELYDEILSARSSKNIVAIANSLAASAAYWLGSAASEFYVTPGGEVGSIGVFCAHEDYSKYLDEMGVKTTLIQAGKYKTEGNPYGPMAEEALAFMQSRIDDYYATFTKAVAKGRGVPIAQVREGMGQGRCLGADAALAEKMVDGVATFDQVLRNMGKQLQAQRSGAPRRASADRTLKLIS